jgi:signal transduction histidine kinase
VVWLARRFPLDAGHRLRHLGIHIFGALTFALLRFGAMSAIRPVIVGAEPGAPINWWLSAQNRFLWDLDWCLMVYAAIVCVSHAFGYYHEAGARQLDAARLETRLVEARLKTLESELHPHFLFNTLHAISTLVHRDRDAADRMISRLSDLLRITFDRSGAATVALKEEIDFLRKYIDIEQIRFQDRLRVTMEIDPDTLDAEVPRMIMQPLVENALMHGLERPGHSSAIHIAAGREDDRLWLQVRDSGSGPRELTQTTVRTGTGLANTRGRLDLLYPGRHRVRLTREDGGQMVRIDIPFAPVRDSGGPLRAVS